ncbi:MAG: hypothetical protein ACKOSO_10665, partial [Actinomycetota bacterium]
PAMASLLTIAVFVYVGAAAIANVGATAAQCGLGVCEDPPYDAAMSDPANVIDGITPGVFVPTWRRGEARLRFAKGGGTTWSSPEGNGEGRATLTGSATEELSITGGAGCGDAPGTYDVQMEGAARMTLTPVDEPCAARAAALGGAWAT